MLQEPETVVQTPVSVRPVPVLEYPGIPLYSRVCTRTLWLHLFPEKVYSRYGSHLEHLQVFLLSDSPVTLLGVIPLISQMRNLV